jgi:alpha-tubulin suppressor-like RCC1 family protein
VYLFDLNRQKSPKPDPTLPHHGIPSQLRPLTMNMITRSSLTFCLLGASALLSACGDQFEVCETCGSDNGDGGRGGDNNPTEKPVDESTTEGEKGGGPSATSTGKEEDDSDPRLPKPCAKGTFDHDGDLETQCANWTDCEAGFFVQEEGSADTDKVCAPCESGSFSTEENAEECSAFTECPSGVVFEGSTASDAECASPAVDVAVGDGFSCIVRENGTVSCWGRNEKGQLGTGDTQHSGLPKSVVVGEGEDAEELGGVVQISAGQEFVCALRDDDSVWCWGANESGQLGTGTYLSGGVETSAVLVSGLGDAAQVTTGASHACALLHDGSARCWGGGGTSYALGGGSTPSGRLVTVLTGDASKMLGIRALATGSWNTCALLGDGTGYCWGTSERGEVANIFGASAEPMQSGEFEDLDLLGAGHKVTCWGHVDGRVSCHGQGPFGENQGERWVPVEMPVPLNEEGEPEPKVSKIALDDSARCMLFDDGSVSCWGYNHVGQLGDGTMNESGTLLQVEGLSEVVALDAGYSHVCAVEESGRVFCWGGNESGELGNASILESSIPTRIPGLEGVVALRSGAQHTCAALESGRVNCWGSNAEGQLGTGSSEAMSGPSELAGITNVAQLSAFGDATLALKTDGTVRRWGAGVGGGTDTPSVVNNLSGATRVAAGGAHSCALMASYNPSCWGDNTYGQVGVSSGSSVSSPTVLTAVNSITDLALGDGHSCGLSLGQVKCWGLNNLGQGGNEQTNYSATAYVVEGLVDATSVALGNGFSLALRASGEVVAWGNNATGQLGVASAVTSRWEQEEVPGLTDAVQLAAGSAHACAVVEDGTALCWGENMAGQLGLGIQSTMETSVQSVKGLTDAMQVTAGAQHSCALHSDGTVSCWGSNSTYQLGHERIDHVARPQEILWQ